MKGINIIVSILFPLVIPACTDKYEEQDCSKLRKGEFEYRGRFSKRDIGIIRIKRNDSIQTEINEQMGVSMKFKIEWSGDCRYILRALSASMKGRDTLFDQSKIPTVTTQIKKVTKEYYICETSNDKTYNVLTDTIVILKLTGN